MFFNVTMYVYLFVVALAFIDVFTFIQTGRWLIVSWKHQKGKDFNLSTLKKKKKTFKLDQLW